MTPEQQAKDMLERGNVEEIANLIAREKMLHTAIGRLLASAPGYWSTKDWNDNYTFAVRAMGYRRNGEKKL